MTEDNENLNIDEVIDIFNETQENSDEFRFIARGSCGKIAPGPNPSYEAFVDPCF